MSYVSSRLGDFGAVATSPRTRLPSYTMGDLRAGLRRQSWTLTAFLNNVTDKRAVLFSSVQNTALGLASPLNTLFVRPRTFGVSAARIF